MPTSNVSASSQTVSPPSTTAGAAICRVDPREAHPAVQLYDDPTAALDFQRLTGHPCHVGDLSTMQPADLAAVCEGPPDVLFTSPPCKSFSGCLPAATAKTPKYRDMSDLAVRGLFLTLEAFVGRGTGGVEKTPMAWRQWLDAWGEPRVREYLAQYRPDLVAVFEGLLPRVYEAPVRKPRKGEAERYAAARAATAERRAKNIPTPSQLLRVKPFDEEETRPLDLGSLRNVRAEYRTAPEQSRRVPCPSFGTVPVGVCIDDWTRTAARMRSQVGRKECLGCALGESRRQEYAGPVVEDEL